MSIRLAVADRIATLTLDRPDALNAFNEGQIDAVTDALATVGTDERVKCLVITGAGDAFSVGLDIDLLGRAFDEPPYFRSVLERFRDMLLAIEALPVPVIAAVNGLARAGGFEVILASDLVLVAEDARIGDTHLAYGIPPGGGATARAPRKLGEQRARELILTGRWMTGSEAAEIGLALRSVPGASLPDAVEELCARFRGLSRPALAATKAAMREGASVPLRDALDVEIEHFMQHLTTEPSASEGYRAFVEERAPEWD